MQNIINNRSASYLIACGLQQCACCQRLTPVVGLFVPAGHETLEIDADAASEVLAPEVWEAAAAGAVLFDVEYLPSAIQNRLRQLSPHYRAAVSDTTGASNWMNHCSYCGAQQGDFDLYCEPEGAFVPISPDAAAKIRLVKVREPFEAQASGYGCEPEFLEYAQRHTRVG
jgi:hypothetical protein